MGRAKLDMELIRKEKSRNITFKKRKEGLIRKLHEFTTLCDVSACMIIYGPGPTTTPEIWPQNPAQVHRVIDTYKAHNKDSELKTSGLSDFFKERKKKIVHELARVRKKNMELKYPTWPEFLDLLSEGQLRELAIGLIKKAECVKSRIGLLKSLRSNLGPVMGINLMDMGQVFYGPAASMDGLWPVDPMIGPTGGLCAVDPMIGPSSSMGGPMICHDPLQVFGYYAPPVPPVPYMVAPPELRWENHDQNIFEYQMREDEAM